MCSWSSEAQTQTRSQADWKCVDPTIKHEPNESNEFRKHAVVDNRSDLLQYAIVIAFICRNRIDFIERKRVANRLKSTLRIGNSLLDNADLILPRLHEERANARGINLGYFIQRSRKL